MSTQFFLDENDIEILTKLLVRSKKVGAREALCIKIGVKYDDLPFQCVSSNSDFVVQLIDYLNNIKDQQALCKLCKELLPYFREPNDASKLKQIICKLKCEPLGIIPEPIPPVTRNKFIIVGAISIIGLTGVTVFGYNPITNFLLVKDIENALQQKQWELADQKTTEKLLKEAGKRDLVGSTKEQLKLNEKEIKTISCPVLQELNQLWESNSQGRFGFAKQYSIWKSVNPDNVVKSNWNEFAARVGWKEDGSEENNWTSLSLTPAAKEGHLPSFIYVPSGQINWDQFFNRIQYCNL